MNGVNSSTLQIERDTGRDGNLGSVNQFLAKDVFRFSLGYSFAYNSPILFIDLIGEKGTIDIQVMLDKQGKPLLIKKQ